MSALVLVALLGASTATGVAGQTGADASPSQPQPDRALESSPNPVAALERHLDSLLVEADRWEARAEEERAALESSLETELERPIVQRVDGLTIRALPRDMAAAAELFTETWAEHFAPVLGPPPEALADQQLTYYDARGPWNPLIGKNRAGSWPVIVEHGTDPRARARQVVSEALIGAGPRSMALWSEFSGFDPSIDPLHVRRQLSAVPSRSAPLCFRGDLDACAVTLGLKPRGWTDEQVVRAWYEPLQLHELLVRRRAIGQSVEAEHLDAADHLIMRRRSSVDAADSEAVRSSYWLDFEQIILHTYTPADRGSRSSLLRLALQLGGVDAALERWMALPIDTPLEDAIEVIADRPLEGVVAAWYSEVIGSADEPVQRDSAPTRSTLAWIGILSAFAMTSTRWRVR